MVETAIQQLNCLGISEGCTEFFRTSINQEKQLYKEKEKVAAFMVVQFQKNTSTGTLLIAE